MNNYLLLGEGSIKKMAIQLDDPLSYKLCVGDKLLALNDHIGSIIRLTNQEIIRCIYCGKQSKKSYSQGYCFPCSQKLARCDLCMMSPERCHYDQGTCREPDWGHKICMQKHVVYLANSSGIKVGITQLAQLPTRWFDQGASQALVIFKVSNRRLSGLLEMAFRKRISDKTNWRKLLKEIPTSLNLPLIRDQLIVELKDEINRLTQEFGVTSIEYVKKNEVMTINYPVSKYPEKIISLNLDKQPIVEGILLGIKGQYLILNTGVINIRKYTGYYLKIEVAK